MTRSQIQRIALTKYFYLPRRKCHAFFDCSPWMLSVACRLKATRLLYAWTTQKQWVGHEVITTSMSQFIRHNTLHWRHNDYDGVSNHQPRGCLLNRLFRRRSKKTSKLCVTGLCVGNSPGPVNSPHKGPVTRKMFPFDDVIMKRTVRRGDLSGGHGSRARNIYVFVWRMN